MSPDEYYLAPPLRAPELHIPPSSATASVSVIDTGARADLPITHFLTPTIATKTRLTGPAYAFLITHCASSRRVVFDLSIRPDVHNLAPALVARIQDPGNGWRVTPPPRHGNVADVLRGGGVDLGSVQAVIWSHGHWDHVGDPSTFPPETDLVVGPGFRAEMMPGWPVREGAVLKEEDWAERAVREVVFDQGLRIGGFEAVDFWGDGSFYLLSTPGHAVGHLAGLVRVRSAGDGGGRDAFVFMGGDIAHHASQLRPSPYRPLPRTISPDPLLPISSTPTSSSCPATLFTPLHPDPDPLRKATTPFCIPAPGLPSDYDACLRSVQGCIGFDACDDVLVVLAHDESLLGVLGDGEGAEHGKWLFPNTLDRWREEGLGELARWRFLADFSEGVDQKKV
ncbi:uncharacterized protein K452DRAFT_221833 [Aplosporella prunicola CBS 121167]|uniref:Metallo-beta-lactamase domain-containing protein n=1 Tax=Aplosporella prunicola CBS 121167 TaxID=1176127 RepID=A0A6A6BL62_9PEZI|nr:uncharacterized protein K452DRAFT_221833 [Aplosporella prunicola CBS 121167]KAF2144849.1 hypothetical protein K452DRAFT_221833 [Aplosporella prunicola CBS 121167]